MSENKSSGWRLAIVGTIVIVLLLIYLPSPAFSQQSQPEPIQDLIVNGGFEGGFQEEYGIGYGWGGFSNGNAVVGWNYDDWSPVVAEGNYSQQIEIKEALDQNRYAGLYQTVSVVPGEQYKLSVTGLIRSEEGSIQLSDYGYRLQYAVDYKGGTSWELIEPDAWREMPWDEQPLAEASAQDYEFDTFETTITAENERLTIFIRGWKKWINNGTGIFNIDDVSFVGPAPVGFQAPVAQVASVGGQPETADGLLAEGSQLPDAQDEADESTQEAESEADEADVEDNAESNNEAEATEAETDSETMTEEETSEAEATETDSEASEAELEAETESPEADEAETEAEVEMEGAASEDEAAAESETVTSEETEETATESTTDAAAPAVETAPLPVSGLGGTDTSVVYILMVGVVLLLVLFTGAVTATMRQPNVSE